MVQYVEEGERFGEWHVVRFFEQELNKAGNPIRFTPESSEPAQLAHAKSLLKACKYVSSEVKAIIEEYCRDEWLIENQPDLAFVVRKVDEMRAKLAKRQQVEGRFKWEDL